MLTFNRYVMLFLLLIALLGQYAPDIKAQYIVLVLTMFYGARMVLMKPKVGILNKKIIAIYRYSVFIFVYLNILSVYYLINADYANLTRERDIFAQLNYMILYAAIFVYMANMIIDGTYKTNSTEKVLTRYIYLVYVFENILYYVQNESVAHSAYLACLGLILFSDVIAKLLHRKSTRVETISLLIQVIVLFLMPIMGYLRGATITLGIIVILYIVANIRYRKRKLQSLFLIIVILSIGISVLSSEAFETKFRETNTYNYSAPQDILSSISNESDANRDVRVSWWDKAIDTILESPIWGTAFTFEFQPFGSYWSNASMLHSFYAALLVDTGLTLIILYLVILLNGVRLAVRRAFQGSSNAVKYLSWNIALISTYATNAYGHVWRTAVVMAILHSYALLKLYDDNIAKQHKVSKTNTQTI